MVCMFIPFGKSKTVYIASKGRERELTLTEHLICLRVVSDQLHGFFFFFNQHSTFTR